MKHGKIYRRELSMLAMTLATVFLAFQNCSKFHNLSVSTESASPAPVEDQPNLVSPPPLPTTTQMTSTTGQDTYTIGKVVHISSAAEQTSCDAGYSAVSATATYITGRGSCIPSVSGGTVTYGCVGDYYLQVVCAKTTTTVFTDVSAVEKAKSLDGLVLSATDIEVPSGSLVCGAGISGGNVSYGGCGLQGGQTGYALTAISAPVVDAKVFTDQHPGFDGLTGRLLTCPSGYKAVSAVEFSVSGAVQCIPQIADDKVYYGTCQSTVSDGNYTLMAVCAKISGTGVSSQAPIASTYSVANTCQPPRHYHYDIPANTPVSCNSGTILSEVIPDRGNALAKATMVFHSSDPSQIYFWNSQVVVGNSLVSYAVGDDVCPGVTTSAKSILAFGNLSDSSATVNLIGHEGVVPPCTDGVVTIVSGAMDVWVEDSAPGCANKDIGLVSSYDVYHSSAPTPAGFPDSSFPYLSWTNSASMLMAISVPPTNNRSSILVFGSVEGTPVDSDYSLGHGCGGSGSTIQGQIVSNLGVLATDQVIPPYLFDMGHAVIAPQTSSPVPYNPHTWTSVSLSIQSNLDARIPVTTGGCCGDGKIGFVKQP